MPNGTMDCADLQAATETFIENNYIDDVSESKCYLLIWYLLSGNIEWKLLTTVPQLVIRKAKDFIIRRGYYEKDGKRRSDIEAHYETLCGHLQFYTGVESPRRSQCFDQLHWERDGKSGEREEAN